MNDPIASRPRRRLRRMLLLLLVLAVAFIAYRITLHRMVEAKLNEIRRQGYPVTLAELDKWYQYPPSGVNAADEYMQAFAQCDRFWGTNTLTQSALTITNVWPYWTGGVPWMRCQLLPVVGKAELPPGCPPLPQELKNLMAAYISDHQKALELLDKASHKGECRYPIDLTEWFHDSYHHWDGLSRCADLLRIQIVHHVENGDTESTIHSIACLHALADSLRYEPHEVSLRVRLHLEEDAVRALQYALNRAQYQDAQLAAIDVIISQTDNMDGLTRAFIGNRCKANDAYRTDPWLLSTWVSNSLHRLKRSELPPLGRVLDTLFRASGMQDIDQLSFQNATEKNLVAVRLPLPQRLKEINKPQPQLLYALSHYFSRLALGPQYWVVVSEARATAQIRCARVALAIEKHRLEHGDLPGALETVTAANVNADPFTGQPLRYQKLAKGYVVYSVGEDGQDDGGDEKKDITFTVER